MQFVWNTTVSYLVFSIKLIKVVTFITLKVLNYDLKNYY
jgi:hypothetical protein